MIWKEGRQGAASLYYQGPNEEQLVWLAEHHARVGIRASLAINHATPLLATLQQRNWDVTPNLGTIPEPYTSAPLPTTLAAVQDAIEKVVQVASWQVWLINAATLDSLTAAGHQALLSWLGDHHARIWCAPQRDIATWLAQQTNG